jgi:hypothetical protein
MKSTVNSCLSIVCGPSAVVLTLSSPSSGTKWQSGVSTGIRCGQHHNSAQQFREVWRGIATMLIYKMYRAIGTKSALGARL